MEVRVIGSAKREIAKLIQLACAAFPDGRSGGISPKIPSCLYGKVCSLFCSSCPSSSLFPNTLEVKSLILAPVEDTSERTGTISLPYTRP